MGGDKILAVQANPRRFVIGRRPDEIQFALAWRSPEWNITKVHTLKAVNRADAMMHATDL
jgi:hypothetical protein